MFRSALLILSGNAAASILVLARNLIVAKLISVEDYGIAATFAIAMSVVEMMSALGLQQQIVQSKDGDDPRFQAGLQGFQLLRGVIAASILFLSAGAIGRFLNLPELTWAYQVMALVPIFNALQHFDVHRLNRQMRFWPIVLTGVLPALVSLIAVWPLFYLFGDYRVMLFSIILQGGLMMLVSHIVAERPYRLVLDPAIMAGSLRFGWPLLVNGILLFAVFNGDKLIVARALGMETLAIFAMGITLTLTPTLVMAKSAQNFFLPQLSKAKDTPKQFGHLGQVTLQVSLVNGGILLAGIILFGGPFVMVVLGEKYADLVPLLIWLAVAQAVRVFKSGPSVVALAQGFSSNAMIANLPRVASLLLIWVMLAQGAGLVTVIGVGILAELLGYGVSLWLLRARTGISLRPSLWPLIWMSVGLGSATLLAAQPLGSGLFWVTATSIALAGLACALSMTDLRRYIDRRRRPTI